MVRNKMGWKSEEGKISPAWGIQDEDKKKEVIDSNSIGASEKQPLHQGNQAQGNLSLTTHIHPLCLRGHHWFAFKYGRLLQLSPS